jgi:two-component system, NtrC family, nitrogen regulation sensor histidine kinase NtrY
MSPLRRFLAVALCLAALAGGARWLESRAAESVRAQGEAAGARAAERALGHVEGEVLALERDLHARAAALAADPRLRAALLDPAARPEAVQALARLRLPEGYAAELYTPMPEPVAWRGPAFPLDPATRRLHFLDALQTAALADGAFRDALVAWHPVREGDRVIGAVRVGRLVRMRVPVRNEYLRDFDLAERWARGLAAPLTIAFDEPLGTPPEGARVRRVRGVDGAVIARIVAYPPSPIALERAARRPYADATAFFLLLLLGWGTLGLGLAVRALLPRALGDATPASRAALTASGLALLLVLGAARYALLALDIPARFASPGPTPPAFDPAFLGSGLGGGVAGSVAELVVTALFAVGLGVGLASAGLAVLRGRRARARVEGESVPGPAWALGAAGAALLGVTGFSAAAWLLRRATEDATLGYFERTGPLSDGLVVLAFGGFLLVMLGAVLWMTGLALLVGVRGPRRLAGGAAAMALAWALAYALTPLSETLAPGLAALVTLGAAGLTWALDHEPARWTFALTFRGALLSAFALTLLTYPVVFDAVRAKEEARALDALEDFADGEDPRVAFALESVLLDARASEAVRAALGSRWTPPPALVDSLAADLVAGSLLAALGDYRVRLTLHARDGTPLGAFRDDAAGPVSSVREELAFERLRRLYGREAGMAGLAVERRGAGERSGRYRYAGIGPVRSGATANPVGWVTAHAEPRPTRHVAETPFPRVLVPAGLNQMADEDWAFAEFADGVLLRSRGGDFGRFRLGPEAAGLAEGESVWTRGAVGGQPVRIHYFRLTPERVVAVRIAAVTVFDHLYYLLRLLTPGLALAALAYAMGPFARRAAGAGPPRPRLRDRVLNRFLLVGLISVAADGVHRAGRHRHQNRDAVEEQLKRRLARVEAALTEDAAVGELPPAPERILDRARLDVIGPRLGLDVNLYRGAELAASSRSQLVRQRLIEGRLPAEVVEALLVDGQRYAFATERIGRSAILRGTRRYRTRRPAGRRRRRPHPARSRSP